MLEGEYEFTVERDGRLETVCGGAGTTIAIPPQVPHTFKNATAAPARLLFVHQPAALEHFFEEFGVPADGDLDQLQPPDPATMIAALERNGVHILAAPAA